MSAKRAHKIASSAGIDLPLSTAIAIQKAGIDILQAVREIINPRVVETPHIIATCADGKNISVRASISLRPNLMRLIGGTRESTIIARVTECIISCAANTQTSKELQKNPEKISKHVLVTNSAITKDCAFDIMSIDIIEIL